MDTKVVCGFPGIGKSHLFREAKGLTFLDSDSTDFSWADPAKTVRNPAFPKNYINHIRRKLGKADVILVSSHDVVREALVENGIHFFLVAPNPELKDEFLQRYKDRGSPPKFVELLDKNWEDWVTQLDQQVGCKLLRLDANQYLSDAIEEILASPPRKAPRSKRSLKAKAGKPGTKHLRYGRG